MALIPHSHPERLARKAEKRRRLLGFLRTEFWTTPEIAGVVMGISDRTAIRDTLLGMSRDDLIVQDEIPLLAGKLSVVGITMSGQAQASEAIGKQLVVRVYERGRIGLTTIHHTLDLQRLRIVAARAGWKGWTYLDRVTPQQLVTGRRHRADALVVHPDGFRVALECERTIKTRKRYRAIVGEHLESVQRGEYDKVVWACPTETFSKALDQVLASIPRIIVSGRDLPFAEQERACMRVCTYAQFPVIAF